MRTPTVILCLVLPALLFGAPALNSRDGGTSRQDDPYITVDILSKHFRILSEHKGTGDIAFSFPPDTVAVINETGKSIPVSRMIICHGEEFTVKCGDTFIKAPHSMHVSSSTANTFGVHISGETALRTYPLPLNIGLDQKGISCVISEKLSRYAINSASAEYGGQNTDKDEAIIALAMIIRARGETALRKPVHSRATFCDLSHCQVYRGRMPAGDSMKITCPILPDKFPSGLFFHSSCGGETLCANVFTGTAGADSGPVKDRISSEGTYLCRDKSSAWEREISCEDITRIIGGDSSAAHTGITAIDYDRNAGVVILRYGSDSRRMAAEEFRLKLNRVRGWNFIRSNNYMATVSRGIAHFKGSGLGHGVGLCQTGALALSGKGFSRYEIIRHYFPEVVFSKCPGSSSPDLAYCRFALDSDAINDLSYRRFLARRIPMGSAFKLVVSFYILNRRPDIAQNYGYLCNDASVDQNMPRQCHTRGGHGRMTLRDALPVSCNLFFASLYNHIDRNDFTDYVRTLSRGFGMTISIPRVNSNAEFARLLSGLDFRATATVNDLIILTRVIHSGSGANRYYSLNTGLVSLKSRQDIRDSLSKTFTTGTASEKPVSLRTDYDAGDIPDDIPANNPDLPLLWGKTSTFMHGSNSLAPYGAFIGGVGNRGIIVLIRNGNGNLSAWRAKHLLLEHYQSPAENHSQE